MIDLKGKRLLLLGGSLWKDVIQDYAKHKGIEELNFILLRFPHL